MRGLVALRRRSGLIDEGGKGVLNLFRRLMDECHPVILFEVSRFLSELNSGEYITSCHGEGMSDAAKRCEVTS
jgi:hypothetical protein